MKKGCLLCLCTVLISLWLIKISNCAILPTWNDESAYHPIPVVFVHGMNSSPEAWGYLVDSETGKIFIYGDTALKLYQYFDEYLAQNPITKASLLYLEPFNYQFNTFDSIKWNAWEGYNNTDKQYPDERISSTRRLNNPTLRRFIHKPPELPTDPTGGILLKYQTNKIQLVAHSLGGVVSRYYLHNTKSGGANVTQLTTLGSPHKGATVATIAEKIVCEPLTDVHNFGIKKMMWVITLHGILDKVTVGRYPAMIDELQKYSPFMVWLNEPFYMSKYVRHYCIADALSPCSWISWLPGALTDGFIDLDSALAVSPTEQLPCPDLEEYKPKGYLPKYKGKLLTGKDNWHIKLTSNASEILKAIDDTKPVIELTEVKDTQNRVIWRVGQWPDYFEVSSDGRVKVHGLCRKEYLPADTFINIGFRKAGQTDVNWITESGGTTPDHAQARQWLLQPSDLWIASNPDSPVAEFEVEINFPLQDITHSIVVQATNPAGIKSDPVEVSEKTHYIYAVGKDNKGEGVLQCLDGPTSFADGVGAVVSEFNLIDEQGNKINARPLDVTTDGSSTIWVSFDNRRIYCYDITTMKSIPPLSNQYYYTTTDTPDGLYYDGSDLQYCSSTTNKLYRVSSSGMESRLVVSRRLSLDGVATDNLSVNYTTQEYTIYNPTGISRNFFCSSDKINKRDSSNSDFIQTVPTEVPIWTNEQDIPAQAVGMTEVTDYSVPEWIAVYLSCTDGNIYKVRFVDKVTHRGYSGGLWVEKSEYPLVYGLSDSKFNPYPSPYGFSLGRHAGYDTLQYSTLRGYLKIVPPTSFIEARSWSRGLFKNYQIPWDSGDYEPSSYPIASGIYSLSYFDESWLFPPFPGELLYDPPLLSTVLWTIPYDGAHNTGDWEVSPTVRVTDVTNLIPTTTFYVTGRYEDEGQAFSGVPSVHRVVHHEQKINNWFFFLIDNGSLEILNQFRTSIPMAEGIATGPRVKIRIKPEFLLLNVGISREFKVNGKGPYTWESSDETVAEIEGTIPQINGVGEVVSVKAVGIGESTLSVRDALGNIAYARVVVVEI